MTNLHIAMLVCLTSIAPATTAGQTAVAPIIEVRDRNNLPVGGATVTFTTQGGKTAVFAGGSQTLTVTTNAAGGVSGAAIAGIAGGAAAAAGALVVAGKGSDGGDQTTRIAIDPAAVAASGVYSLQTINGVGLPAIGVTSPPASCPVVFDSATLTLAAQGDLPYEVTENSRTECRIGPSTTFRSTTNGTWSISGTTVLFRGQHRARHGNAQRLNADDDVPSAARRSGRHAGARQLDLAEVRSLLMSPL